MAAPFMYELLQLLDMKQNELAGDDVYDAAVQQLLDRMLESPIPLEQKQQGLKAAALFVTSPSVLHAAGNKLVQMRLEQFGDGGAGQSSGPSQATPCSVSTSLTDSCKYNKHPHDGDSSTSMDDTDTASQSDTGDEADSAEDEQQEMEQLRPEEKQYDEEAAPILAAIDAAVAAATAAAGQQPAADQATAGQQQPALDQAAAGAVAAAAAGASDGGEEDADMDSEQLSDPDTDDAADEVAAADKAALREIARFQKATHRLTSRAAFSRIVQDVLQQQGAEFGINGAAVDALQRAGESFVSDILDAANRCAIHAGRQKITVQDMHLAALLTDNCRLLPRNG